MDNVLLDDQIGGVGCFKEYTVKAFIVIVMANWLIADYVSQIGVNVETLSFDLTVLVLFVAAVFDEFWFAGKKTLIPRGQTVILVAFSAIVSLTLPSTVIVRCYGSRLMSDVRIRLLYWIVVPSVCILLESSSAQSVYSFLLNCGIVLCIFAIAQALFAPYIDFMLLSVEYDGALGLSWGDSELVLRSNVLMGNSIKFGGVCLMLFCVCLAEIFLLGMKVTRAVKAAVVAAAYYSSYLRVAFAGLASVFVVRYFMLDKSRETKKS